jgi:hypothetical protein
VKVVQAATTVPLYKHLLAKLMLGLPELSVVAAPSEQLAVGAPLCYTTLHQHQDLVSVCHSRQAVCDADGRASSCRSR